MQTPKLRGQLVHVLRRLRASGASLSICHSHDKPERPDGGDLNHIDAIASRHGVGDDGARVVTVDVYRREERDGEELSDADEVEENIDQRDAGAVLLQPELPELRNK